MVTPFAVINGELLIGTIDEYRALERHPVHNPTGFVANAPRGSASADQSLLQAADEKLDIKLGQAAGAGTAVPLDGRNTSADSAWLTYDDTPDGQQGGVAFFAVEVPAEALERADNGTYRFKSGALTAGPGALGQKVLKASFGDWRTVVAGRDMFTIAGVARLFSHLVSLGRLKMSVS